MPRDGGEAGQWSEHAGDESELPAADQTGDDDCDEDRDGYGDDGGGELVGGDRLVLRAHQAKRRVWREVRRVPEKRAGDCERKQPEQHGALHEHVAQGGCEAVTRRHIAIAYAQQLRATAVTRNGASESLVPRGIVCAQPGEAPRERAQARQAIGKRIALAESAHTLLADVQPLRRVDQRSIVMLLHVERDVVQPFGNAFGQRAHGRSGVAALVRSAQVVDREGRADLCEDAPAEQALPRVGQADRHDLKAERPASFSFSAECNARGTGAQRRERGLGVALSHRIDLHRITAAQRRDGAAERVFVTVHLRRVILWPVDGQSAEAAQHGADEALLEEWCLGQRPCRPARDAEDDERIEQTVRMIRDDEHRTRRDGTATALDGLKHAGGASGDACDPVVDRHARRCAPIRSGHKLCARATCRYVGACILPNSPTASRSA
jgi:hypothetical protein